MSNPLKKWVFTNKYYIKCNEPKEKKASATHYLLDGGIWKIPKGEYLEFLRLLSVDLQNNEKHYISENRTEIFKFICDLDFYEKETAVNVCEIVNVMNEVIEVYFGKQKTIICGSDTKEVTINEETYTKYGFHIVYPKIWINVKNAKTLRLLFIEKLTERFGERGSHNQWTDVVDLAVYEDNGLRMVGCRKIGICKTCKNKKDLRENCQLCSGVGKIDENRIYRPIHALGTEDNELFLKSIQDYYVMLLETSIYNYNDFEETPLLIPLPEIKLTGKKKKPVLQTNKEDETTQKIENFIKRNFKQTHGKIKLKKITKTDNIYFVEPDDNFCINVNRNHTSSGIYFKVEPSGVSQRCYCKKETLDGRSSGMCKDFSSTEIPLSKLLSKFLFGDIPTEKKKKNIVNMKITKNQTQTSLDLSVSKFETYKENIQIDRDVCLRNCKVILEQIENELLNLKK